MSSNSDLKLFVERLESLAGEKQDIADQIKDVKAEAKAAGYDLKVIAELLKLRRMKPSDRAEREELLESYKAALGMLHDLPLGQAAMERAA